ncbi:uncharacterized protein BO97DRAFT_402923 [Aspergillus homomorphus CBS 101889]|uniref:Uncharacterized protein n=1 Tax=Aspergillus homomorphus (strain CBS 101889) TaxID=1450537 RepID=A0A395I921_ASPHC|nr:hypothetical protein BO97DRAFT_402923 [Aspergillus homomorphus CBS 101889]RAL16531.1 hypothetical protein BO97DRAFT_402923 [Aspergillus homomorphus CBS 101889]
MAPSHSDHPGKPESTLPLVERPEADETAPSQNCQYSSVGSDLSHHLYFDDNDGFFPPSWLGQKPPVQAEVERQPQKLRQKSDPNSHWMAHE